MVTEFWSRMIDEYASKWEREYGQFNPKSRDVYNWGVKLLQVIAVLKKRHGSEPAARVHLKRAMGKVFEHFTNWPPTPVEFKAFVLGPRLAWSASHKHFRVERLPAATRQDSVERAAREMPKIRQAMSGGRMSREDQNRLYDSIRKPVNNPEAGI